MYRVILSRRYKTALKRFSRHTDFSNQLLEEIIATLARGERLSERHHDHQLTGELKEYRECPVKNDMLLMYQKNEDVLVLLLVDLGTHDDLFR
ncbi:MAG: type II toxin-antitoxin system YafQ family toxin [Candidatus Kaiserbacteria bacterium]|nr:type II toxin-antitoxin system YafQ family toxin [Candidatus Kaiserbacteria bacterium]